MGEKFKETLTELETEMVCSTRKDVGYVQFFLSDLLSWFVDATLCPLRFFFQYLLEIPIMLLLSENGFFPNGKFGREDIHTTYIEDIHTTSCCLN